MIGGHGPALSLVTEGTAYVNRVRDVLRRRVVTSDGFWPVKKLRVLEEASWVVVGDKLPREIENPLYRYLIAISKLRLGILTEQGEGF